jgi:hypothetical protein
MLAGHADLGTTANIYAQLDTSDLETALKALNEESAWPLGIVSIGNLRFAGSMEAAGIEPEFSGCCAAVAGGLGFRRWRIRRFRAGWAAQTTAGAAAVTGGRFNAVA